MQKAVLLRSAGSTPPSNAPSAAQPAVAPRDSSGGGNGKVPAAGPRKLMSDTFEMLLEEAGQQLSDANDFTVIGVLGEQGVGKSTVMSLLAGAPWAAGGNCAALHEPPFAQQSPDVALQAAHQTCGIDLYVTGERLILLDTQPLLSPSVLLELQRHEGGLPSDAQSHENMMELQALRLAMLLLSSCHLIISVHDVPLDPLGLRTLRLAQMLRHRLPEISNLALASPQAAAAAAAAAAATIGSGHDERAVEPAPVVEYVPRLAFLFNRAPPATFASWPQHAIHSVLRKLFTPSGPTDVAAAAAEAASPQSAAAAAEAEPRATPTAPSADGLLVMTLPEAEADDDAMQMGSAHLGFRAEAEAARDALLAQRRLPFAHTLSERDWLRGVGRMWEVIKRSALLADYNRALQKLHSYV